jgi:hypothetical protein
VASVNPLLKVACFELADVYTLMLTRVMGLLLKTTSYTTAALLVVLG